MKCLFSLVLFLICYTSHSETSLPLTENTTASEEVFSDIFWNQLYAQGGWSLYCGFRFENRGRTNNRGNVLIEHIYPTSQMLKHLSCNSRLQCRTTHKKRFQQMETDLHNMYPVWWEIKSTKINSNYGEIPGEDWRFSDCDYERKRNIIEPRPIARGNIARAIFYMYKEYGLPVDNSLRSTLINWNLEDPPSEQEQHRNDFIEQVQRRRNPFVDNPELIDTLEIIN